MATLQQFYIGYSEAICSVAKRHYRELRGCHLRTLDDVALLPDEPFVLNLVGKWWRIPENIAIRFRVLTEYAQFATMQKHLALKTSIAFQVESVLRLSGDVPPPPACLIGSHSMQEPYEQYPVE